MVNEKQTKRERNIKSKLMAAIAMLLVSSIMMVSTTYAWFTLSTAPEVTGITTNIASNGNLEIALSPASGIGTDVLDATLGTTEWTDKNLSWGNLLDLSDNYYGLSNLTLAPAALSLNSNVDSSSNTSYYTLGAKGTLATPSYGTDGRISSLSANAFMAHVSDLKTLGTNAVEYEAPGDTGFNYGIRAVGTTSGLSPQATALRDAQSAMSAAITNAKKAASDSLNSNGQALTAMLVKHAVVRDGTDKNDYVEYADELDNLVTALESSVTEINEALKAYLMAGTTTQTDDFEKLKAAVNSLDMPNLKVNSSTSDDTTTYSITVTVGEASETVTVDAYFAAAVAARDAFKTGVDTARTKLTFNFYTTYSADEKVVKTAAEGSVAVNWSAASDVLYCLMNANGSAVLINDKTLTQFSSMGTSELVKYLPSMMSETVITLLDGSGLYYDLAEITGNFVAGMKNVEIGTVTYGDITVEDASIDKVTIKTDVPSTNPPVPYLPTLRTAAGTIKPVSSGASQTVDANYGYIVDMMVRTNAADTKLLLQTEGAQRVYDGSSSTATMGGGTSFTFTTTDANQVATLQELLNSIRVVFFDPSDSNKVMGIAKVVGTPETDVTDDGKTTVTGYLQLCEIVTADGTAYYGAGKALTDTDDQTTYNDGAVLCSLAQNTAQPISALVYLDGFDVTSNDVLADQAITGALNLQFASSATLTPMMNSDLFNAS